MRFTGPPATLGNRPCIRHTAKRHLKGVLRYTTDLTKKPPNRHRQRPQPAANPRPAQNGLSVPHRLPRRPARSKRRTANIAPDARASQRERQSGLLANQPSAVQADEDLPEQCIRHAKTRERRRGSAIPEISTTARLTLAHCPTGSCAGLASPHRCSGSYGRSDCSHRAPTGRLRHRRGG